MSTYPPEQVEQALKEVGSWGKAAEAVFLVLTTGVTAYAACKQTGADQGAVSRLKAKVLRQRCCPLCGGAILELKQ